MIQWEYCEVHTSHHDKKTKVYFYTAQGSVLQEFEAGQMGEDVPDGEASSKEIYVRVVAQLGLDGWEAYAVTTGRTYFKRPIEE